MNCNYETKNVKGARGRLVGKFDVEFEVDFGISAVYDDYDFFTGGVNFIVKLSFKAYLIDIRCVEESRIKVEKLENGLDYYYIVDSQGDVFKYDENSADCLLAKFTDDRFGRHLPGYQDHLDEMLLTPDDYTYETYLEEFDEMHSDTHYTISSGGYYILLDGQGNIPKNVKGARGRLVEKFGDEFEVDFGISAVYDDYDFFTGGDNFKDKLSFKTYLIENRCIDESRIKVEKLETGLDYYYLVDSQGDVYEYDDDCASCILEHLNDDRFIDEVPGYQAHLDEVLLTTDDYSYETYLEEAGIMYIDTDYTIDSNGDYVLVDSKGEIPEEEGEEPMEVHGDELLEFVDNYREERLYRGDSYSTYPFSDFLDECPEIDYEVESKDGIDHYYYVELDEDDCE